MKYIGLICTAAFLPATLFAHPEDNIQPGAPLTVAVKTGSGDHQYEADPKWGLLPEGKNLGPTHGGVAVDKAGNVYTSTDAKHAIVVLKPDGTFLKSIAPDCVGLHGLTINDEDGTEYLYGAHGGGRRIVKLTLDGKTVMQIPHKETGDIPSGFGGITSIAVAPDGSIFTSCGYGSNLVHKFDKSGKIVKTAGGRGKEDGKFMTCHGLVIDKRGDTPLLLVMDRENRRLVHLSLDLEFKGVHTTGLRRPCAASIWGDFVVVAELESRAAIVGKDGKVVAVLGDNPNKKHWANFGVPKDQQKVGIFTAPHGVSFDSKGNVYVQDWNRTGRITKLARQGAAQ